LGLTGGRPRAAIALAALFGMGACASSEGGSGNERGDVHGDAMAECEPVEDSSGLSGDQAIELEGEHTLVLVARTGPAAGARVQGELNLRPQESELQQPLDIDGRPMRGTVHPLVGTATLPFREVGATVPGDPASEDPEAPGVLVLMSTEGPAEATASILLRIGSEANVRGRFAYDGAYTVLRVRKVEADAFFGGWESGGANGEASGYFCALET